MTKKSEKDSGKSHEIKISAEEFEKKVIELAKEGFTAEKIGEELRKQKIHPQRFNKKISKILKGKYIYISPDLKNLEKKLEKIKEHYKKNKQDKRAMREKDRIFAQLKNIKRYIENKPIALK